MMTRMNLLAAAAAIGMLGAAAAPALADSRVEKKLKLEAGGTFVLEADGGGVTLKGGASSGAKIVITSRRDDLEEKYDIKFEEGAGTARVIVKRKNADHSWFHWNWGGESPHFEIEVPTRTTLDLSTGGGGVETSATQGDAEIKTGGGSIEVADLVGKLVAHTGGGHIELRNIKGDARIETSGGHIEAASLSGTLDAKTSGGHIELKEISGDIKAGTSGGHIEIVNAGGRVEAETSGGSVSVSFARGNAHGGIVGTSGGSVLVRVDGNADLNVDAEASGGSVQSSLPVAKAGKASRSHLKGAMGKGGEMLAIHTSGGSIQIQPL